LRGITVRELNEDGVSEAIGFILILGLVISGIALVTLYGYPVLLKEQTNTDVRNMERAMIVIQNDMKSLCYKSVPYKESSLQVSGGSLEVINASSYSGSVIISNGTWTSAPFYPGALTYRSDRGTEVITLENGAVVKRQDGAAGSTMLAEPRWFYDSQTETFVIYLIGINATESMSKSGMGFVRMGLGEAKTETHEDIAGMTVSVTLQYPAGASDNYLTAWENYLSGSSVGMSGTGGTYTRSDVDRLVIKTYDIRVYDI
jgi:hypothetical protein